MNEPEDIRLCRKILLMAAVLCAFASGQTLMLHMYSDAIPLGLLSMASAFFSFR